MLVVFTVFGKQNFVEVYIMLSSGASEQHKAAYNVFASGTMIIPRHQFDDSSNLLAWFKCILPYFRMKTRFTQSFVGEVDYRKFCHTQR